jgi:hypothetical protein
VRSAAQEPCPCSWFTRRGDARIDNLGHAPGYPLHNASSHAGGTPGLATETARQTPRRAGGRHPNNTTCAETTPSPLKRPRRSCSELAVPSHGSKHPDSVDSVSARVHAPCASPPRGSAALTGAGARFRGSAASFGAPLINGSRSSGTQRLVGAVRAPSRALGSRAERASGHQAPQALGSVAKHQSALPRANRLRVLARVPCIG